MAPQWALLLVLTTLLAALELEQHDPSNGGYSGYSEQCPRPQWDDRLQFRPDRDTYAVGEELRLTCPGHLKPSFTIVICAKESLGLGFGKPDYGGVWWGMNSTGAWMRIVSSVWCVALPETCPRPWWDTRLRLAPDLQEYRENEEVTLSCSEGLQPSYTHVRCAREKGALDYDGSIYRNTWQWRTRSGNWLPIDQTVQCLEQCPRPQWDDRLQFRPDRNTYAVGEKLWLTCPGRLKPSFTIVICAKEPQGSHSITQYVWWGWKSSGDWTPAVRTVSCRGAGKCTKPLWDPRIRFVPDKESYNLNKTVTLRCSDGYRPSATEITCVKPSPRQGLPAPQSIWLMKNSTGSWQLAAGSVRCVETCQRPHWDPRLRLAPDQEKYRKNEEVTLSCPEGLQPSYPHVRCSREEQTINRGKPVNRELWLGRDSSDTWTHIRASVECVGKCQKPQWDPRIRFVPDKASYNLNETVILTCPVGYWLSHTEVSCMEQNPRQGSTASQSIWHEKNGRGRWQPVERNMICVDVFQVVAGTLEVSSTSIKLNWTCSLPDACQNMQAVCQLAGPSSPPCKAEKVMEQEILHGQKGTFACPPLQPFTVYSVTISVPPSTILFTQHLRTKAMVPQKPEQLQLDARTGTLRWKALPSCRGEIIGYQLNFTARRAHDGTFLNFQQVTVNHSVTQYTPPPQSPGSKYTVTVQGLTAAGAGDASSLEFQAYISVSGQFLGSWPWTAVTVVVVLSVMVILSAVIVWFMLSRRRKAVPIKAEEDHYIELQPYENSDIYCMIKGTSLSEEEAGTGGQDREPASPHLPILESSGD